MKVFLLSIATLIVIPIADAQSQHLHWNTAPQTGFVFQITNNEAQKLLTKSSPDTIINSMLHTQVDTFNVNKGWTRRPGKGHFIMARVVENKLHCEYTSVFPYQVLLLREYNALSLQVLDLAGNVRSDAKVRFRTRRIRFDSQSKTYRIENQWFSASHKIVTVELDGFRSVFNIEKHEVPTWSHDYYHSDDGPDFYSYMITDKNKYKPGERVRFKSYALSGTRNPIRKDLEVWLIKPKKTLRVAVVSPHRPGSFAGEIFLHDSLKLTLDKYYSLQLWDKSGRVVSQCSFKYEDYELNGEKLQVELETTQQFYPASNRVKITATNENGLMLKGARARVTVLTDNIRETFQPLLILPDTLLYKEFILDDEQAAEVEIPSSIFQKSNTTYYVHVSVLNSQNQQMEKSVTASHLFSQYELNAKYAHDSIVYVVLNNGVPMKDVVMTTYRDDESQPTQVTLPYKEKINPSTSTIRFQGQFVSRTIRMADMLPTINLIGGIEKDSFRISVDNPQKVEMSWYIYQGSLLLEKGAGQDLQFKSKIENRDESFYVEVLYAFGGSDHVQTKEYTFRESALNISLDVPDRVYPGKKVDALIQVTNEEGDPVSGVDLTALATTAKLNYYLPSLPYYGGTSSQRPAEATYSKNDVTKHTAILDLNYNAWAKRSGLDTMKYYQFIYPGNKLFVYEETTSDSTQFAIYVMKNGIAKKIHVIEVDRTPVYYSWTDQPRGYSFYIEPDKNKAVTLRLHDRVLILDSISFEPGKKTIISLDLDHLPGSVKEQKIPPQIVRIKRNRRLVKWVFTDMEVRRHSQYVAAFKGSIHRSFLYDDQFVAISNGRNPEAKQIVGPIIPGTQTYVEEGRVKTTYRHEGNFSYSFEDNVVYKMDPPKLLPPELKDVSFRPILVINDVVINRNMFLEQPQYASERWHPRVIDLVEPSVHMRIMLPNESAQSGVASVLFQNCNTGSMQSPCRNYSGSSDYVTIPRGCYHTMVLYNNGSYLKMQNVEFRTYSNIIADMRAEEIHSADSSSLKWLSTGASNCFRNTVAPPRTLSFTMPRHNFGNVHGTILDDMRMPLPGANIVVKGTSIGTVADLEGRFVLDIPEDPSTLVVSFIGYKTEEIETRPGSEVTLALEADVTQLQEVVVVGYGSRSTNALMSSVSTVLQGRVAGVSMNQETNEDDDDEDGAPPSEPTREAEQRLYQELLTLNTLRSHFSDVGFWEPRLFTDHNGRSKFPITFPDDITRWDAVVYGMNRELQTGTARKSIKSYKPLMAELFVPQFLTEGDSSDFLGKVSNYSDDKSIQGKTRWKGSASRETAVTFNNYYIEKYAVTAQAADTVTTSYAFTRDDGYFDGEERKVPVIPQGTVRANGTLTMLTNDGALDIKGKRDAVTKIKIFDNQVDLYKQDIHSLINYRYDCNEQLASKLIGLLNYQLVTRYEGKKFQRDRDVNKIIQRLLRNQNNDFLWSWWDVSPHTSFWMSAHILHALKQAKDAGYVVNLDLNTLSEKATYKYDFLKDLSLPDLQIINALADWNIKLDYRRYIKILEKEIGYRDSINRATRRKYGHVSNSLLNEKLLLLEVRQLQNLPLSNDSLLRYKKQTVLNEVYFSDGQESYYWYNRDLPTNAIAYRIIRRDSSLVHLIPSMQMYFLSLRRSGEWNTYESSNVLRSMLPDLVAGGSTKKSPATVMLTGKINSQVQNFPLNVELREGEELHVKKQAGLPLYCMQLSEERVTRAQAGTDAFKIKTVFSDKKLKEGTPAILETTIEVKRDARLEHVMIEIPIPGACSYSDKIFFEHAVETHREYFKEKTVIFCENMSEGTYVFRVPLMPRFTGRYHVNPAQVSLMYFPVINTNTDMKILSVSGDESKK